MSDQVDSGLEQEQVDGGQNVSQSQGGSETQPGNSLAGAELAEAVLNDPIAAEALRRKFQSDKDRGVASANKTSKEALSLTKQIADYLGIDPKNVRQAQRDMVLDQIVDGRFDLSELDGGQEQVETRQTASSLKFTEALVKHGLNPAEMTSSQTNAYLASIDGATTQQELEDMTLRFKATLPARPEASAGSVATPSGKAPVTKPEIEVKTQKFIEEYTAALNSNNTGLALQLKAQARKEGLPIDNIKWNVT